jgi:hypothetical protein
VLRHGVGISIGIAPGKHTVNISRRVYRSSGRYYLCQLNLNTSVGSGVYGRLLV